MVYKESGIQMSVWKRLFTESVLASARSTKMLLLLPRSLHASWGMVKRTWVALIYLRMLQTWGVGAIQISSLQHLSLLLCPDFFSPSVFIPVSFCEWCFEQFITCKNINNKAQERREPRIIIKWLFRAPRFFMIVSWACIRIFRLLFLCYIYCMA